MRTSEVSTPAAFAPERRTAEVLAPPRTYYQDRLLILLYVHFVTSREASVTPSPY